MREIKYRGKVGEDFWYVTPDDDSWAFFWEMVDRETVGQYTDMHDKHGVEIYEGDIVRHQDISWGTYVETVKYENGLWNYSSGITSGSSCQKPKYHWEVIGNIYENPDLMGGNGTKE